uniref:tRNA-dihydrouridine synthase n=1 Tax=Rhodosorus marinus TaxID=101924 RepID=A0A7S2Z9G7_9RHOD|mmetsp:Transcript_1000/g.2518  ORF Transcript_1000/g.2518 Transcript_1000/m.2518 type:complete len:367 (+) Transcript_1000:857-1957(+)|eukprot:CAMPEP_0113959868 /NCGR_PEP_ID=MMETSP0011_2-20120614/4390_1 /TAXON_ID=101924 /ORGANISM="Rhodosorus marinus" /LENGTH=366 /DNA_ID=CAMNT_0000971241 /DNA_START=808 /DNA_END=1908 /DNA_ORIENTATION=- /assembly_acc=CAM_ASM_000156
MESVRPQTGFALQVSPPQGGLKAETCPNYRLFQNWDGKDCPMMLLAPMEVLADKQFRKAVAAVGGMDEMVMEFIRIPDQGHPRSLANRYKSDELGSMTLSPQIMGSHDQRMWVATRELVKRGAYRVDLNCGCPASRVTKKGSGASLLKTPSVLGGVVRSMIGSGSDEFPNITVKMRSGFEDTQLFLENVYSAIDGGARAITVHPRTSYQKYNGLADWNLIGEARKISTVPIIGNGDITSVQRAAEIVESTGCDAIMIGRGAVRNPWLFHEIRAHFTGETIAPPGIEDEWNFWSTYRKAGRDFGGTARGNTGRLKMILGYYFDKCTWMKEAKARLLRSHHVDDESFLYEIIDVLEQHRKHCTDCSFE